jgi:hypothetical protein
MPPIRWNLRPEAVVPLQSETQALGQIQGATPSVVLEPDLGLARLELGWNRPLSGDADQGWHVPFTGGADQGWHVPFTITVCPGA